MLRAGIVRFETSSEAFAEFCSKVTSYATSMVSEGFLSRKVWSIYHDEDRGAVWVSGELCHDTALQDALGSAGLVRQYREIEPFLSASPKIECYDWMICDDHHYCPHNQWDSLTLMCGCVVGLSSIFCTECGGFVASYRLPLLTETSVRLWNWDRQYDAIDACSMTCAEYEAWADDELSDVKSKINRSGLDVAARIARDVGCEVRYFLHTKENQIHDRCPWCGSEFQLIDDQSQYDALCPKCGIATQQS